MDPVAWSTSSTSLQRPLPSLPAATEDYQKEIYQGSSFASLVATHFEDAQSRRKMLALALTIEFLERLAS